MRSSNYKNIYEKDYQKLMEKYDRKSEEYKMLKYEYQLLQSMYSTKCHEVESANKNAEKKLEPIIKEKDSIIEKQANEISRLKALLNMDGTNSNIPTSQTPINKKKVIPNTRTKSGKSIWGQKGHKKYKLEKFKEDEINEEIEHKLTKCPGCGGVIEKTGVVEKDELSYRFVPIKRRHKYITYKCKECHKEVHEDIPVRLKEENQYGSEINALALTLTNEGNVPCNKIRKIIKGISHNEIDMSEGYIIKLQKKASKKLKEIYTKKY